jgi:hypothetical protein
MYHFIYLLSNLVYSTMSHYGYIPHEYTYALFLADHYDLYPWDSMIHNRGDATKVQISGVVYVIDEKNTLVRAIIHKEREEWQWRFSWKRRLNREESEVIEEIKVKCLILVVHKNK